MKPNGYMLATIKSAKINEWRVSPTSIRTERIRMPGLPDTAVLTLETQEALTLIDKDLSAFKLYIETDFYKISLEHCEEGFLRKDRISHKDFDLEWGLTFAFKVEELEEQLNKGCNNHKKNLSQ